MILITGTSGFIGFHLAKRLLKEGYMVVGVDNETRYYNPALKTERREILKSYSNFKHYNVDICNLGKLETVFKANKVEKIVHLAGQAGVRYSITDPFSCIQANIVGFHNVIYLAKKYEVVSFVYASSSSVYGEYGDKDLPVSLYATTKKTDELIAYNYCLQGVPTVGLRFFTVYGPYGRPDMAIWKFTDKILKGEPIDVYNYGKMKRSFTYIDDIIEGIVKAMQHNVHYGIYDLGNDQSVDLAYLIRLIEKNTGKKAKKNYLPMQQGDVKETHALLYHTKQELGWSPEVSIEEGIEKYVEWYKKRSIL